MGDKRRSIQTKPPQSELARWCSCVKAAIGEQQQVTLTRLLTRVPQDRGRRLGGPIRRLVQVAPPATVDEVVRQIGAALGLRAVVIDRELSAAIRFGDPAIFACEARPNADEF